MNSPIIVDKKKAVLIRVPVSLYEDLLNLSAASTLLQRRSVSVPSLVVELVREAVEKRAGRRE